MRVASSRPFPNPTMPMQVTMMPAAQTAVANTRRRWRRDGTGRSGQPRRVASNARIATRTDARNAGQRGPARAQQRDEDGSRGHRATVGGVGEPDRGRPRDPGVRDGDAGEGDRQDDTGRANADEASDDEQWTFGDDESARAGPDQGAEGGQLDAAPSVGIAEDPAHEQEQRADHRGDQERLLEFRPGTDRRLDRRQAGVEDVGIQPGGRQRERRDQQRPEVTGVAIEIADDARDRRSWHRWMLQRPDALSEA